MVSKHVLLVVMCVCVAVVWLTSCNLLSPETRAEVLTQQNCLRGCIDRCPPQIERYRECATNCGRSEERRVGKEWRSRWSPSHEKKKSRIIEMVDLRIG